MSNLIESKLSGRVVLPSLGDLINGKRALEQGKHHGNQQAPTIELPQSYGYQNVEGEIHLLRKGLRAEPATPFTTDDTSPHLYQSLSTSKDTPSSKDGSCSGEPKSPPGPPRSHRSGTSKTQPQEIHKDHEKERRDRLAIYMKRIEDTVSEYHQLDRSGSKKEGVTKEAILIGCYELLEIWAIKVGSIEEENQDIRIRDLTAQTVALVKVIHESEAKIRKLERQLREPTHSEQMPTPRSSYPSNQPSPSTEHRHRKGSGGTNARSVTIKR